MKINFVEKFDLYEKLENLISSVNENENLSKYLNSALYEFKKDFTPNKVNSLIGTLNNYNWISEVDTFIAEFNSFTKQNKYGLMLENIMMSLSNQRVNTYSKLVDKLRSIVVLDENQILGKIIDLNEFKYEPNVRNVLAMYEQEKFGQIKKENIFIQKGSVSPVMETENGLVFTVGNKDYFVNEEMSEIKEYSGNVSSSFKFAKTILPMFTYLGEGKFEFVSPNGKIKIVTESNKTEMFIDESKITDKNYLNTVLKVSKIINYADIQQRSAVEFMYENAHTLIDLDFVKHIKTKSGVIDVFSLDESVYTAEFDLAKRTKVLKKLSSVELQQLQENLSSEYKLDFDLVLESFSVNKEAMEFNYLVESINVKDILHPDKTEQVYESLKKANSLKDKIQDKNKISKSISLLESKNGIANLDKVLFLVETRKHLIDTLNESEQLSKSLDLVNNELVNLLK